MREFLYRKYKYLETRDHELRYLILKSKMLLRVSSLENIDKLDYTAELLIKYGITNWRLFRIFSKGNAENKPELQLSFEESQQLILWISSNRQKLKKSGLRVSFSCEGYLPFFCRSGINIASILSGGTITGCNNNDSNFYQGNLINNDFQDIWENGFNEYREH